ncbi:zinc finger protein 569-like [Armigeres subalbatus]|uniref:zinc finger protein 569-like n=1 Tax=Armigeres subalbatus TaxID=124917 RepID=UPI002ED3B4DB
MSALDFDKICRLCCEKKGRLRPLFQFPPEHTRSLPDIIFDISRLQMEPGDGMPQKICRVCVTTLEKMQETIESYRANDLKLREQLGGMPMPLVEIKEEEVDVELLEQAFTQELKVENIALKQEVVDDEYLDYEQLEELNVEEQTIKNLVSKVEKSEDEYYSKDAVSSDEDWKPNEDDDEDEKPLVKKQRKMNTEGNKLATKKPRKRRNPNEPPKYPGRKRRNPNEPPKKPGRKRIRFDNPNRPRLHDHKCYICMSDSHGTPEALIAHLNSSHSDMVPYTCTECVTDTVVIRSVEGINFHKRQHLNPEKCPYCDKRYSSKNNVDLHIQLHHAGEADVPAVPSTCEYCGKVYPSKVALLTHIKIHTSAVACEVCGKVFVQRNKLRLHIERRHQKMKNYECHVCKKKLTSLGAVTNHIKTYHSNQIFKCSYCPKTYTSELTHRYHEKKHTENQDYVAPKEWKEYYTVLEGEEGKKDKLKKCKLCGVVTRGMGTHLSTVHFPTEYRCKECGMTFKRKQTYDIHVQEHEYGKAHRCPICGREFSERKNLLTHLRTKKHQDHPLAQAVLSTVRTPNWAKAAKETSSPVVTKEEIQIELEVGDENFM